MLEWDGCIGIFNVQVLGCSIRADGLDLPRHGASIRSDGRGRGCIWWYICWWCRDDVNVVRDGCSNGVVIICVHI